MNEESRSSKRALGFILKLSLWHATFFALAMGLLCTIAYIYLANDLRVSDRKIVSAKLSAYRAWYSQGGAEALQTHFQSQSSSEKESTFLEVINSKDELKFFHSPQKDEATLTHLGKDVKTDEWLALPSSQPKMIWTVARTRLPDGSIMMVGRTTQDRAEVLGQFRNVLACIAIPLFAFGLCGGAFLTYRTIMRRDADDILRLPSEERRN